MIDDFCKTFNFFFKSCFWVILQKAFKYWHQEIITKYDFLIHNSGYRTMEDFNTSQVSLCAEHLFLKIVSCNPFFELIQEAKLPLAVFVKTCFMGQNTGISFIDSRPVRVFKNKRILRKKSHCRVGCFFNLP